jgi:predicted Zn-dependent protease
MKVNNILAYVLIAIFSVSVYFYIENKRPCNNPITYKIGKIDSGFNMDSNNFLNKIDSASKIWESELNKNLFEYDPNGDLTINLIYDYRQKNTDLRGVIDNKTEIADSVKDEFLSLTQKYEIAKTDYEDAVDYFNKYSRNYKREEFNSKRNIIENQRLALNALSDQINVYVKKYNTLVRDIDSDVNVVNKDVGQIEQGLYTLNGVENKIDIFEYENESKLVRVLAHELGHAIGLEHNTNREAIMYELNNGVGLYLTSDDIMSLKSLCRIK